MGEECGKNDSNTYSSSPNRCHPPKLNECDWCGNAISDITGISGKFYIFILANSQPILSKF